MQAKDSRTCIGINGFGRIGRLLMRAVLKEHSDELKIVGINEPFMDPAYLCYQLTHDSVHGAPNFKVGACGADYITINDEIIPVFAQKDPAQISWTECGAEFIAETSGAFTTSVQCQAHLVGGAKKVILSAPAKDDVTPVLVMGVNHASYDPDSMNIVSNASCTTNCLAPLTYIVNKHFGIVEGLMSTIHAMTASQKVVDAVSVKDWRAGRCAIKNIIPATTGAAEAVQKVIPELSGKLTGMAFRVPVANVSVLDLTCKLQNPINSVQDIVDAIEHCTEQCPVLKAIMGTTTDEVVSSDFNGDSRSCVLDRNASIMLNSTFVKLVAYYDNEWAYAMRMVRRVFVNIRI